MGHTILMPDLTPYDRGEVLQPDVWHPENASVAHDADYGKVDFDTDEGQTLLTVRAVPEGPESDDDVELHITNHGDRPLRIFIDGALLS
jgi:hypothetical protein